LFIANHTTDAACGHSRAGIDEVDIRFAFDARAKAHPLPAGLLEAACSTFKTIDDAQLHFKAVIAFRNL
jgi:hypothetical protein